MNTFAEAANADYCSSFADHRLYKQMQDANFVSPIFHLRNFGNMETWRHGDGDMEHGDIDIRRGNMDKWRHGEMEAWRHGHRKHGDMDMETWKQETRRH
jgi:hypothetical protein